jgi:hypothetical protein
MPAERRHEAQDLEDYEVLDSSDTLAGPPGDDPLDRGVVSPERWSAGMRFGSTAAEQSSGRSLDLSLTRENPDDSINMDETGNWDENATSDDIRHLELDEGPDPRTGRLLAAFDDEAIFPVREAHAVARDAGIDSGGATAEEASMHLVADGDSGL